MSYQTSDHLLTDCMEIRDQWQSLFSQAPCNDDSVTITASVKWRSFSKAFTEPRPARNIWQVHGTVTTYLADAELDQLGLDRLYIFQDQRAVLRFLQYNAFLIPLLFEVSGEIQRYFQFSPLRLEIFSDYEEAVESSLIIYILSDLSVPKALEKLDQFYSNYWLGKLDFARGKLHVDVEPV